MPTLFSGEVFTFTQPDGTTIELRGWGNQDYAVFEDRAGYTVVQDPISGYYHYASLNQDHSRLVPTGAPVGSVDPRSLALAKGVRVSRSAARAMAVRAAPGERKRRWEERREQRRRRLRAARSSSIAPAPPTDETAGVFVGLCLLIDFPDVPGEITKAQVENFCNKEGYDGFGNNGSVRDYFSDVSRGRLQYTNVVAPYYTAAHPRSYYTDEQIPQPVRARELINEALAHLKANNFDFGPLTADTAGYIFALNVFYAGSRVNNWAKGLWPHSYHLGQPQEMAPGRLAFDYQFTDMGPELTLATFCHENGHMICDFPDLYDYGGESVGAGVYCLMCYGGPNKKNPTRIGGYLRYKAGWADSVTPVTAGTAATLSADKNDFYLHAKNSREYFLIENRWSDGRDKSLPSAGLAIWHVDEEGDNDYEHMTEALHYECSIEQADGGFDLETNENAGDKDDLFSAATQDAFGDNTRPSSRWWDGTPSGLEIRDIGAPGPSIQFSTGGVGPTTTIQASSEPGADIPDSNSAGYHDAISLTEPGAVGSLEVTLNISHSYRGDLRVTLVSPAGATVVLHDRQGGSKDHLQGTFDATTTPGLTMMTGEPIQGDWILHVQDLAPIDVGKLEFWKLTIHPAEDAAVRLAETPGTTIPDDEPAGISRTLTADAPGTVGEISVAVDITHTYIRDLIVTLISPSGTSVDLHHRTGGSADNIVETFTAASTPELEAMLGETIQGDWVLKISDQAMLDYGKLNRWEVTILPAR